jgi:autotransporter translocation and assembly factor TamB
LTASGMDETKMAEAAGRSLARAAGNLLANGLGSWIGINNIGVAYDPQIDGTVLKIGHYLSPNLYVSHGIGLLDSADVTTLRFRINDRLSIQALQGPVRDKVGISFRMER